MAKSDYIRMDQAKMEISDSTGYDHGDKFTSEQQVRDYFTVENMREMGGGDCAMNQETLDRWADFVVAEKLHCTF